MKKRFMALLLALVMCVGLAIGSCAVASTVEATGPIDPRYDLDYIRSLPLTEANWSPINEPISVTGINTLGDVEEDNGPVDPRYDLDYIHSLPLTEADWVTLDEPEEPVTPSDSIGYSNGYVMLKGIYDEERVYADVNQGGYYYAVSTAKPRTHYCGVFVNVQLPAHLNRGNRNAFISLGINNNGLIGSTLKYIDVGLVNLGDGWVVTRNGDYNGTTGKEFDTTFRIPSIATNVIMMLEVKDANTIELYVQAYNKSTSVGTYFKYQMNTNGWTMNSNIRFFRFASMVPANGNNNMFDGTYMAGGAFTNCQMYNRSEQYYAWGINASTNLIERAWMVNPEHISVVDTEYNDSFEIFHYRT